MQELLKASGFQKSIKLYHGSKSGISGNIIPCSRPVCDFGKGFYLGDKCEQPKSLIAKYENAKFYECQLNLSNLSVKSFDGDLEWALFIAYNRGFSLSKQLISKFKSYDYDLIVGPIADDSIMTVINRFFDNTITDEILLAALKHVKLGNQYVCKTQKACNQIEILSCRNLTTKEIQAAYVENRNRFNGMNSIIKEIEKMYRHSPTAKYFDELIFDYEEESDYVKDI